MKKRLNFYVLAVVFISITATSALLFFHSKKLFSELMHEEKMQLTERIKADLNYSQAIMELVEHQIANNFQEATIERAKQLAKAYPNPVEVPFDTLQLIADEIGVEHFFLIDKKGVIKNSTLFDEIGYDLNNEGEAFMRYFNDMFRTNQYRMQGWGISSVDKSINAYSYYVAPGANYAVETSVNLQDFLNRYNSTVLSQEGFNLISTYFVNDYRFIKSVDIYNVNDAEWYSLVNLSKELFLDEEGWHQLRTKGEYTVASDFGEKYYALIKTNATQKGFPPILVLEAGFDYTKYYELVRYNLIFNSIVLLIILIVVLLASPQIIDRLLIKKINIINYNLNSLRLARYDEMKTFKGNDELSAIADNIMHVKNSVLEREKQLQASKVLAEAADKLKSAFLANMSHEIRTPLNAVVGFAQLLRDTYPSPDDVERYVNLISVNSNRLLQLISDIIDLSQIESGQLKVLPRPVCLNDLYNELFASANSIIVAYNQVSNTKDIKVLIEKEDFPVGECIITDPYRLKQILEQLVDNAIKFTCKGFVKLGYQLQGDRVCFYVSDSGAGISPENQSRIFGRFVQAEEYLTREHGGTGLGLAICRELLHILGGTIEVESVLNQGSTFKVYLPYTPTGKK
jgi:signal transduction histidine kinase